MNAEELPVSDIYVEHILRDVSLSKAAVIMDDMSIAAIVSIMCASQNGFYYYIGEDGMDDNAATWVTGRHLGEELNQAIDMK